MKNLEQAQEALTDMPPRSEAELDPVTLHNMALMHMDTDATGGLRKLNFLLSQVPPPPHAKKKFNGEVSCTYAYPVLVPCPEDSRSTR